MNDPLNNPLNKIKEYINDLAYNVKKVLPLKDGLDKIIEREYKKAFEILEELGIIKYIEDKYIKNTFESLHKYGIIKNMYTNYEKPKLEILENDISKNEPSVPGEAAGEYSLSENKIKISKKSLEMDIDNIDSHLELLGYKEIRVSIGDIQYIEYPDILYNLKFLYPFYVNDGDIIESIARAIILSIMFHEIWHSIDFSILDKLEKDPNIKDRDYLLTILNDHYNLEVRASAFEVVMYYLVNGFHKDEKGYMAAYKNIPECRKYIEEIDKLENNGYKNIVNPYELGFCYGNIIVAKYGSSLKENIHDIIKDIIYLDKKRAIDEIKHYI
jgi:hypothetical protein